MQWHQLLNPSRLGGKPPKAEPGRSPFNSDHDKIIFSGAFRRLARKTQVHPMAQNDHVHNRLTHSLEVGCVGRSLGILAGLKLAEINQLPDAVCAADLGDIVQATCLAHDIGNPPFGHTGEEAIKSWFMNAGNHLLQNMREEEAHDLIHFEGNAQGFRVLTSVENHINKGGMRLTYATLAASIKYPWTSLPAAEGQRPRVHKFGVFSSELETFHEVAEATGLLSKPGDNWYCRHPLAHLMEAADDFCYGILDLEDGLEMEILGWDEFFEIIEPVIPAQSMSDMEADIRRLKSTRRKLPLIRGKVIETYIEAASDAFLKHQQQYLDGDDTPLIELCPPHICDSIKAAKSIARQQIYNHARKVELEIGAYNVIATLLDVMCHSVIEWIHDRDNMSFRSQRVLDLIGEHSFDARIGDGKGYGNTEGSSQDYLALRRVVDFLSGMTDNYAIYLAKQFNGMAI
ncbi:Deoxyguanosinetriphosphate triphosphohydrolase [BD1-7 clade bacterium]|nr:Deoxyguanosinetriphosphate triphosphohydrolase [BD1-7 clade bacterium]